MNIGWQGTLNDVEDELKGLGLDIEESNSEYIVVSDAEDNQYQVLLGGTPRTITIEKVKLLGSLNEEKDGFGQEIYVDWNLEDIEAHKSVDWKERNYKDYPVESDAIESEIVLYGVGPVAKAPKKRVRMIKFLRANPIYSPYYASVQDEPFNDIATNYVGPMYDGHKHNGIMIMDRYETQKMYDNMFEDIQPQETKTDEFKELKQGVYELSDPTDIEEFSDWFMESDLLDIDFDAQNNFDNVEFSTQGLAGTVFVNDGAHKGRIDYSEFLRLQMEALINADTAQEFKLNMVQVYQDIADSNNDFRERLNEDTSSNELYTQLFNDIQECAYDKLNEVFDNFTIAYASEHPEYNTDWAPDSVSEQAVIDFNRAQTVFAAAVAKLLLANFSINESFKGSLVSKNDDTANKENL